MDEKLVRARGGDAEAFSELLRDCSADMYRMAYAFTGNEADALDAVQEASYRAFRSLRRLKHGEYFRTWLMRITINCALDIMRREKRRGRTVQGEETQPGHESDVVTRLTVEKLMGALDAAEKTVVLLHIWCGCTFGEIAMHIRRPAGTAKTIYYRAIKKLRQTAEEEGIYE